MNAELEDRGIQEQTTAKQEIDRVRTDLEALLGSKDHKIRKVEGGLILLRQNEITGYLQIGFIPDELFDCTEALSVGDHTVITEGSDHPHLALSVAQHEDCKGIHTVLNRAADLMNRFRAAGPQDETGSLSEMNGPDA